MTRILLLGGTTEASVLARALAKAGVEAVFSYAGRTRAPVAQPLPTRVGGFGGVAGLVAYLRSEQITHMIDATHPFAAGMSRNAIAAQKATDVAFCAFERPAWVAARHDRWCHVRDLAGAVAALPAQPARIFLAIGKQHLAAFAAQPRHSYLLRLVDPPEAPLPLPDAHVHIARGPFDLRGDLDLMRQHAITHVVAKNAGGTGARAKLDAARELGLPVIMIDRPALPARPCLSSLDEVMGWLVHSTRLGV